MQLNVASQIEEKLLQMIVHNDSSEKRSLEQSTLETFDRLRSPELEDFIFAHDPAITLKKNIPSKKESLEDAKQDIRMTHHLKTTSLSMCVNKTNVM